MGPCGYSVGKNPGTFRSPEEYQYKKQSEKVDIYSMGNIFYALLTNQYPWTRTKLDTKAIQKNIINGQRPILPIHIKNSTHPIDVAIRTAMNMCLIHNPNQRATAREIQSFLMFEL